MCLTKLEAIPDPDYLNLNIIREENIKDILQSSIQPPGAAQPHNQDFHWPEA